VRVLAAAVELYGNRLLGDTPALTYLAGRGFGRDLVEQARLGCATGGELIPYLVWRGLPVAAARRVGLLDADGRERLAGRVVFPEIRRGRPTWLIGRLLADDQDAPRYLGLPGRKCLLGWDEASRDLRGVCLVEGPLDLLALRKWGVPGLALCGTRPHPRSWPSSAAGGGCTPRSGMSRPCRFSVPTKPITAAKPWPARIRRHSSKNARLRLGEKSASTPPFGTGATGARDEGDHIPRVRLHPTATYVDATNDHIETSSRPGGEVVDGGRVTP
jgi:hypothetical protein